MIAAAATGKTGRQPRQAEQDRAGKVQNHERRAAVAPPGESRHPVAPDALHQHVQRQHQSG